MAEQQQEKQEKQLRLYEQHQRLYEEQQRPFYSKPLFWLVFGLIVVALITVVVVLLKSGVFVKAPPPPTPQPVVVLPPPPIVESTLPPFPPPPQPTPVAVTAEDTLINESITRPAPYDVTNDMELLTYTEIVGANVALNEDTPSESLTKQTAASEAITDYTTVQLQEVPQVFSAITQMASIDDMIAEMEKSIAENPTIEDPPLVGITMTTASGELIKEYPIYQEGDNPNAIMGGGTVTTLEECLAADLVKFKAFDNTSLIQKLNYCAGAFPK